MNKKYNCGRYRKDIVKDDEFIAAHEDNEAQIQSMNSLEKDAKSTPMKMIIFWSLTFLFAIGILNKILSRCSLDLIN